MGDKTMKHLKGAFQGTLAAVAMVALAPPADARITIDALGGELEVEGFLKSEVRSRVGSGDTYLGQWIQRFQVEAALKYTDVGIFDELTFVAIARPEYDIVQDMGDFSSNRIGDGTTKPSLSDRGVFNYQNEGLAFGGFDAFFGDGAFATGGIGKIVAQGFENPAWLAQNFEVDFRKAQTSRQTIRFNTTGGAFGIGGGVNAPGGGFPQVVQKSSNLNLDCKRCIDLNVDNIDVATANTDSNGRLYPFRELYVDGVIGDWWLRVGKQQIVWGKTDFFRLQDLINPVDFGQHFFFDSFEDIRIPQWMASIQYKAGSFGPLTDNAFQVVWNFDEFQQVGLGNPSHFWAHPFSKDVSTFAIFNTYFSPEPCVSGAVAVANGMLPQDVCGSRGPDDNRTPAGFGAPAGLNVNNRPDWDIDNTEAGFRWEFRLADFRFAVSHWYGWNDIPVFKFHTVNTVAAFTPGGIASANNNTMADLVAARGLQQANVPGTTNILQASIADPGGVGAFAVPIVTHSPQESVDALARSPVRSVALAAQEARRTGNYAPLWTATGIAGCNETNVTAGSAGGCVGGPVLGGQTSIEHRQSHTLGLAMDYFESWSGVVMRIESSWTFDELVNNTRTIDWVDKSDVMRFSLGFDRPTFIPFLNKDRTFFLSLQIFDTWYWDHEGDKNTGYFVDEHNWITTFFFLGNYMRDTLKPTGFYVWEEYSNSHVTGFNLEWLIDNHWSIKGGFHLIWGGDNNITHDTGPFTTFITPGSDGRTNPYVTGVFGPGRQGIGGLRSYDEVFFELKYQF